MLHVLTYCCPAKHAYTRPHNCTLVRYTFTRRHRQSSSNDSGSSACAPPHSPAANKAYYMFDQARSDPSPGISERSSAPYFHHFEVPMNVPGSLVPSDPPCLTPFTKRQKNTQKTRDTRAPVHWRLPLRLVGHQINGVVTRSPHLCFHLIMTG